MLWDEGDTKARGSFEEVEYATSPSETRSLDRSRILMLSREYDKKTGMLDDGWGGVGKARNHRSFSHLI
jgi:hypothetical protein